MPRPSIFIVPGRPDGGREIPNNLPVPPGPLFGREREVATAVDLLLQPEVRLLTLIGSGGVGKTRLALQVAEEALEQFSGGVYLIELAAIADGELLIPAIARTLGLREGSDQPLRTTLEEFLREREALLVLDNFEQILPGARALAEILAACAGPKFLVTSRFALRVHVEHELSIRPLETPEVNVVEPAALAGYPSVALFVQRAKAVRSEFQLTRENAGDVAEITRRVDGLPLALELVAARVKLLPPRSILARLSHPLRLLTGGPQDHPARQQTLSGTMGWS